MARNPPPLTRTIHQLLSTTDTIYNRHEAHLLRDFRLQHPFIPEQHLLPANDAVARGYGEHLLSNDLPALTDFFNSRVAHFATNQPLAPTPAAQTPQGEPSIRSAGSTNTSFRPAHAAASAELGSLRWGPLRTPVYTALLLLIHTQPPTRNSRCTSMRWLAYEARVPVDGRDATGTTALMTAMSCQPVFDLGFAEALYWAACGWGRGGEEGARREVGRENRWGGTAGAEIVQVGVFGAEAGEEVKAEGALRWFVEHGGDIWARDIDEVSPAAVCAKFAEMGLAGGLVGVWRAEEERAERERREREGGGKRIKLSGWAAEEHRLRSRVTRLGDRLNCPCRRLGRYLICCGRPITQL